MFRLYGWLALIALTLCGCARPGGPASAPPSPSPASVPSPRVPSAGDSEPIRIGEYGSLTGSKATFGTSTRKGVDLAIEEINRAGGVLGRKLEVIVEDDQGKQEEANLAVSKLIERDNVVAVIGEVASSLSLAAAPICQTARIPMITPASTNPAVTQKGDYIFRICFIDPFQGTVMARFAHRTLKSRRAAILRDIRNDYSVGLADYFAQEFTRLGGAIVGDESYQENDTDFKAQLTSLRSKKPDALFIPGYYTEVGLICKQARELGLTCSFLGGDGWDSPQLAAIGGDAVEGGYFSNHYSVAEKRPEIARFVESFRARYSGETPEAMAALGYDAAKILADALARAGRAAPAALRAALAQTKGFRGVTGIITLDTDRNAVKPAVIVQMKQGQPRYVQSIAP
ncbi:MAG: ABC transporter substrate-binding protein [Armatimonadetes bacterium]|nr:ABC transporter substrate-binding protein [Armatimonadota bacterium]